MVHFFAILIFLLHIATILSSEFWDDVDRKFKELSDPVDIPTQATLNPTQAAASGTHPVVGQSSHISPLSDRVKSGTPRKRTTHHKYVSFYADEMIPFNHAVTIDPAYPTNLSETDIMVKLMELGSFHEWPDLRKYYLDDYSKYWAKTCTFFSGLKLTGIPRVACRLNPSFGKTNRRNTKYGGRTQSYDLLGCQCNGYLIKHYTNETTVEKFLIHQSSANEYFLFEQKKIFQQYVLHIQDFKGGITLPSPNDFKNIDQ